jgi:hypothetical protein
LRGCVFRILLFGHVHKRPFTIATWHSWPASCAQLACVAAANMVKEYALLTAVCDMMLFAEVCLATKQVLATLSHAADVSIGHRALDIWHQSIEDDC